LLLSTCGLAGPAAPIDVVTGKGAERPFSVQLHVHGSFSEGVGSMDSHSREALEVGADVIWWSDHDFRIGSYRHVSRFGFEDWQEPIDRDEVWSVRSDQELERGPKLLALDGRRAVADGRGSFESENPVEGARSLRIIATSGGPEFRSRLYRLRASQRHLQRRPLASGVTLHLSVFPEDLGPDARAVVELRLSEHAAPGIGFEAHELRYVLSEAPGEPFRQGPSYRIPLGFRPGEWNHYALPISRHAAEGFPSFEAGDDSLHRILIGLEVRRGARAVARFDALRIEQEIEGPAAFQRQAELIDAVAARYPGVRQLQGIEISYTHPHLNEFSEAPELLDYDDLVEAEALLSGDPPRLDPERFRRLVARRAVAVAHGRGGLVSINHMFGTGGEGDRPVRTREAALEELAEERLYGADLLEVGYPDRGGYSLADHLWAWDQLAGRGLHPVGTGVSDSHGGPEQRWRTGRNNFVSWIYAASSGPADLIEGLRAGRVYFGDLNRFRGSLDLISSRGFRMGRIVVTDRPQAELAIEVEGARAGDELQIVESGRTARRDPVRGSSERRQHTLELDPDGGGFVRVAVFGADDRAVVLSNPIHFVRQPPAGGIPAARAAFDLAGIVSRRIEGFRIIATRQEGSALYLRGDARSGSMELDCSGSGAPAEVVFHGLHGSWSYSAPILVLRDLEGSGEIEIRALARPR
jgi:hypothetical protein